MGTAVGIAIVVGSFAVFMALNLGVRRTSRRADTAWPVDPLTGQPDSSQHSSGHHGHHDGGPGSGHAGGEFGGGHHGGGDFGGGGGGHH